jgi:dTDP-4-dehydrorhamnose reductase
MVGGAIIRAAPSPVALISLSRRDLDIADEDAVFEFVTREAPDVIINAAVYLAADQAEVEPERAYAVNAAGPGHLATAAKQVHARLVHLSTAYVFAGNDCVPYSPNSPTNPVSTYASSKRDGERAVLGTLPGRSVVLRTSWLYAAEGRNFFNTMLHQMMAGESIQAVADRYGTPTSTKAFAKIIWQLVNRPDLEGIYHWSDFGVASWYDFAVSVAEEGASVGLVPSDVSVMPIETSEFSMRARRPRFSVLNTSSLTSQGFSATHWRSRLRTVLGEIARVKTTDA